MRNRLKMSQFLVFLYPEEAGWPFLGPGSNIPNGGKWCILEAGQDAKNIRWFGGCGMWEDSRYCWVVICKNHWFHVRQNIFFGHRIWFPLRKPFLAINWSLVVCVELWPRWFFLLSPLSPPTCGCT